MISIVVPCYCEKKNIFATLNQIILSLKLVKIKNYEIIVIDDCSVDNSFELIKKKYKKNKKFKIFKNKKNLGFGGTIKKGIDLSNYNNSMFIPGDNSHPKSEIIKFLKNINKYDIFSTHYINNKDRLFARRLFTKLYTPLLNLIFVMNLPYYNGVSLYKNKIFKKIKINTNSHAWQVELWVKSKKIKNLKYKFIPTILNDRKKGASAFRFFNSIKVLITIIRLFPISVKLNFLNYLKKKIN